MEGKNLLDTNGAGGDLADYERGIIFGVDGDTDALKDLDTRLIPFFDGLVDGDGVADMKGNIFVSCLIGHGEYYIRWLGGMSIFVAASSRARKTGWGERGRDLYSGWAWVAKKKG